MEDSPFRGIFHRRLADSSASIVVVETLAAAREEFEGLRFDGIVIELSFSWAKVGLKLIRRFRAADSLLPIIAMSELDRSIPSLTVGADHFLRQPFQFDEFRLRWERMLMRCSEVSQPRWRDRSIESFCFGGVEVRPNLTLRFPGGAEEPIRPKHLGILRMFADRAGELVLKEELSESIWGFKPVGDGNSINQYISMLRCAFRRHGLNFDRWVICVPKTGWRIAGREAMDSLIESVA